MLLQQLASAAVGGFGASFGRDLYRSAKKNPVVFVLVGALILAFGWRNLFLGQGRSPTYFMFVTLLGSILMILVGTLFTGLGGFYVSSIISGSGEPSVWPPIMLVFGVSLIGVMWGRRDRRAKQRRAEIEAKNVLFLEDAGLQDSGFESDTLSDADGNTLKIREQTEDRIVFTVVGRRGLRAAINLRDGEMVSYTGIVKV